MNNKNRRFTSIFSLLLFLAIFLAAFVPLPAYAQLEAIPGAGFIGEEGEYLSDQGWNNDDIIGVATELITSGGEVSFELAYLGSKYVVHLFFSAHVKPLEFWLNFVQTWRYETGQRSPEDFRSMVQMLTDSRLDIGWFQIKCKDLSEKEGWDHIFENPFAISDPNVKGEEIEGGFTPIYNNAVPRDPGQSQSKASFKVAASKGMSLMGATPPIDPPASFRASFEITNSKIFERFVNEAAVNGYLQNSFGIPRGAKYLDLSYGKLGGGGHFGPDGFFIDKDGKCYLLEMKWHADGAGALGRPFHGQITQGSPEWLQKAMLRIKRTDPKRWLDIKNAAKGTRFLDLCEAVDLVDKHMADFLRANPNLSPEMMGNFLHPDATRDLLRLHMPQHQLDRIAKFWAEDFHFGVVNKVGGKPTHIDDVTKAIVKSAQAFGGSAWKAAKRVMWATVK